MRIGLGLGIPFKKNYVAITFNPSLLFDSVDQGVWYDPSDFKPDWRYNLLSRTEEFENAAWLKATQTLLSANIELAPDGTATADKIYETSVLGQHEVFRSFTSTALVTYKASIYVKKAERSFGYVGLYEGAARYTALFNLESGLFVRAWGGTGETNTSYSVSDVENDWWEISVTAAFPATATCFFVAGPSNSDNPPLINGRPSYTGDGTSGIYIWGASLTTAENADKPYQKITDGIQDYYTYQVQPVLFQDAAGTTPVTALEQPVGLMLDKSKGLVLGNELAVNGNFSAGTTGWTLGGAEWSIANGIASVNTTVTRSISSIGVLAEAGKNYLVSFEILSVSGAGVRIIFGGNVVTGFLTSPGVYTQVIPAVNTNGIVVTASNTTTASIDNISVRELPGNHATQPTATSRPIVSARVNLLERTEEFENAYWAKTGATISANAVVAPDGTLTADRIVETTTSGEKKVERSVTLAAGATTLTISAAPAGRDFLAIRENINGSFVNTYFNLATGVVVSAGSGRTASISSQPNGYYRCSVTATSVGALAAIGIGISDDGTRVLYTGDITKGIYIWGADLRVANDGVGIPSYQRVNTATDYDSTGFPVYLRADGVDDGMVTNSIDFTATDKMTVVAGVRKLSDAARSMLVELSNAQANAFTIEAPPPNLTGYRFKSHGSLESFASSTAEIAPITNVVTGIGNISGDSAILRVNAIQAAISTTDQGTGNYGNYPLYLFRRGGTTLPFNGRFYGLTIVNKLLSTAELEQLETYTNGKTRAFV